MSYFDDDRRLRRPGFQGGTQEHRKEDSTTSRPSPGKVTRVELEMAPWPAGPAQRPSPSREKSSQAHRERPASAEPLNTQSPPGRERFWKNVERAHKRGATTDGSHAEDPFKLATEPAQIGRQDPAASESLAEPEQAATLVERTSRTSAHESAVPLASTAQAAVGRMPVGPALDLEPPSSAPDYAMTADAYIAHHRASVVGALCDRLHSLPSPHAHRLDWTAADKAAVAVARTIGDYIRDAPLERLSALVNRSDIRAIVEWGRSPPGIEWESEIGRMIADELDEPIRESIVRVGLDVWNGFHVRGVMPGASQLAASSALDRVIASVLVQPSLVTVAGSRKSTTPAAAAPTGRPHRAESGSSDDDPGNITRRAEATPHAAQGTPAAPSPVEQREHLDTRLRDALQAEGDVTASLFALFASLDVYQREGLADRLEHYRQGSGDDIGYRFQRLDSANRQSLLHALRTGGGAANAVAGSAKGDAESTVANGAAADPVAIAKRGVADASEPLPHQQVLQPLFGHHDLSGIKAQVGGDAADAAHALDAEAYAVGDRVGFASAPDLGTAAHEAAHAIADRQGGVARKAVDGGDGDPREARADAIAESVSRGENVEAQIDHAVASAGPVATVHRKRDKAGDERARPRSPLSLYLYQFATDIETAMREHLGTVVWPDLAVDVPWARGGERAFSANLAMVLRPVLEAGDRFRTLLFPHDVLGLFETTVFAPFRKIWLPSFGTRFAALVERATRSSLAERLGPQYRATLASRAEPPVANDLTPTHPLDPYVVRALFGTAGLIDHSQVAATDAGAASKPVKVAFTWLGRKHPELWNFVEVTPDSARTVDVAVSVWGSAEKSTMAFAIQKIGKLFRIAPGHARSIIGHRYPGEVVGPDVDPASQMVALSRSGLRSGDAAAREFDETPAPTDKRHPDKHSKAAHAKGTHAKGTPAAKDATDANTAGAVPSLDQLMDLDRSIGRVLNQIVAQVAPLGMGDSLSSAFDARIDRKPLLANADDAERTRWGLVLSFQHTQLHAIAPHLGPLIDKLRPLHMLPDFAVIGSRRRQRDLLRGTLQKYIHAAAVSHLRDESNAILASITEAEKRAGQDQLDALLADTQQATREAVDGGVTSHAHSGSAEQELAGYRQAALLGIDRGKSPYEQTKAVTMAGEVSLQNRVAAAKRALDQLRVAADSAGFSEPGVFRKAFPNLKTVPELIADVTARLDDVDRTRERTYQGAEIEVQSNEFPEDYADWLARAEGLKAAQQAFGKIAGDKSLGAFVHETQEKIKDQAFWNAIQSFAVAMLLTVATGMGAAMIGSAVAGALATEASTLAVRVGAFALDVSINATLNSLVQVAMSDGQGSLGWMTLENVLMELLTRGMMKGLRSVQKVAIEEAQAIAKLPHLSAFERQLVATVDVKGMEFLADTVGGMATQWAAQRLVHLFQQTAQPASEPFAMTVLQQGAAIGLGKFLHRTIGAWHARRAVLEQPKFAAHPEARALIEAREQFYRDAQQLAESMSPDPAAGEQLAQRDAELYRRERALLEAHGEAVHEAPVLDPHGDAEGPPAKRSEEPHGTPKDTGREVSPREPAPHRDVAPEPLSREGSLGKEIAAEADARYIGEGRFEIDGPAGTITVEVRRTKGESKVHIEGKRAVIEISRGISGDEFKRAAVTRLTEVRHTATTKSKPHGGTTVATDPMAKWQSAREHFIAGTVPPANLLPSTPGNAAGLRRLHDVAVDETLPPSVRAQFLAEFKARIEAMKEPPQDLHGELRAIAYGSPEKYLRKGTKMPSVEFVKENLGGLKRALSLKWLLANCTDTLMRRAHDLDSSIPEFRRPAGEMWAIAPKLVDLVKSGRLAFDPTHDVEAATMIGNFPPGASGWFFAGKDANTAIPAELQKQLAVGPEYADGYQIAELPPEMAMSDEKGQGGASRPTALDLTAAPEGKLNADMGEPVGRTDPQKPGQAEVREVVMPPISISATKRGPLVTR